MQRSALCRFRRELSNAYLLVKFGFCTAENEPSKVCPIEQCSEVVRTAQLAAERRDATLQAIIAMKRQRKGEDVDWLQRTSAEFLLSPITHPTSGSPGIAARDTGAGDGRKIGKFHEI